MKRLYIIASLLCLALQLSAQANISVATGNAILIDNPTNIDYVFLFHNLTDASLTTTDNNPQWFKMQGTDSLFHASGIDYLYPENNTGYILHTDAGRVTFWVLDYTQYAPQLTDIQINTETFNPCEETILSLIGTIPEMAYTDKYAILHPIHRNAEIHYQSLAWNDEQKEWQDSLAIETHELTPHIRVGAPLQNTSFTVFYDQFAARLNLPQDSIESPLYEAIAIAAHPTSITTIRGTDAENQLTNEVDRPVEATQLTGSGTLDILFKANPTPAVQYYRWEIRKGDDLLVTRTDEEHRYAFNLFGGYRVLLWVSNNHCTTDSTEIRVSVSVSMLKVPNVFTPNGDNVNDEFRVMYRSLTEFHCWIYNRWGKKVFDWTDPAKGWDGTINGRPAAESAYFYVIQAKGADDVEYKLRGDINLIRGK